MPNKAGSDNFVPGVRLSFTEKVAYDRVLRDEWIGLVINREIEHFRQREPLVRRHGGVKQHERATNFIFLRLK